MHCCLLHSVHCTKWVIAVPNVISCHAANRARHAPERDRVFLVLNKLLQYWHVGIAPITNSIILAITGAFETTRFVSRRLTSRR